MGRLRPATSPWRYLESKANSRLWEFALFFWWRRYRQSGLYVRAAAGRAVGIYTGLQLLTGRSGEMPPTLSLKRSLDPQGISSPN